MKFHLVLHISLTDNAVPEWPAIDLFYFSICVIYIYFSDFAIIYLFLFICSNLFQWIANAVFLILKILVVQPQFKLYSNINLII